MKDIAETAVLSLRTLLWARLELILFHVCILGICGVLIGAFVVQFAEGEMPCPLCLIQRMWRWRRSFARGTNQGC